jgi:nitrogen fixation NifU-like protein
MDISELYSEKVLEHFKNPRNVGEIKDPDGVATVGNPVCGDVLRLFIKIGKKDNQEFIKEAKFLTLGCGAAIATSSMITTMVKGKPLNKAEKISQQAITEALGGLPQVKTHCSVLAAEALKKAIENYRQKK